MVVEQVGFYREVYGALTHAMLTPLMEPQPRSRQQQQHGSGGSGASGGSGSGLAGAAAAAKQDADAEEDEEGERRDVDPIDEAAALAAAAPDDQSGERTGEQVGAGSQGCRWFALRSH